MVQHDDLNDEIFWGACPERSEWAGSGRSDSQRACNDNTILNVPRGTLAFKEGISDYKKPCKDVYDFESLYYSINLFYPQGNLQS